MLRRATDLSNINLRVTTQEHRSFKTWCASRDLSMLAAFRAGQEVLQAFERAFPGLPASHAQDILESASMITLDADQGVHLCRTGDHLWSAHAGFAPDPGAAAHILCEGVPFETALAVARNHIERGPEDQVALPAEG